MQEPEKRFKRSNASEEIKTSPVGAPADTADTLSMALPDSQPPADNDAPPDDSQTLPDPQRVLFDDDDDAAMDDAGTGVASEVDGVVGREETEEEQGEEEEKTDDEILVPVVSHEQCGYDDANKNEHPTAANPSKECPKADRDHAPHQHAPQQPTTAEPCEAAEPTSKPGGVDSMPYHTGSSPVFMGEELDSDEEKPKRTKKTSDKSDKSKQDENNEKKGTFKDQHVLHMLFLPLFIPRST